ncbi:MAG: copper chaperone PCu(A)C [Thauera sp.]|jgi:copper(I)-binding protein|nr:copper chaperone PCu(A)C [Thauera sp.]
MKRLLKFAATMALCGAGVAFAHGYKAGSIEIEHPWSRATVAAVPTGVVYFVLRNPSQQEDRLVSVSTPVADKAELHTHIREGNVMKMRHVDAIEIAPASTTALEPGGLHVMLLGLKQPLVKGKAFPLTLVFGEAGPVTVQVDVQGASDKAPSHTGSGHEGHAR